MPETSPPKNFLTPRGARGDSYQGDSWGGSFLKIYILCNYGYITLNLSCDRCQKPPKNDFDFLRGQGGEYLPKIFLTPRGVREASKQGAAAGGPVFLKEFKGWCLPTLESFKFLLGFFNQICIC